MFWVAVFFWMVSGSVMAAVDACSAEGITKLKHDGWTIEEIKSLCANNSAAKKAPQQFELGQRCATKLGVCNLFDMEPVPVGSPCYCNNPNSGRPDHGQIIH
jgi:hypothetical protein